MESGLDLDPGGRRRAEVQHAGDAVEPVSVDAETFDAGIRALLARTQVAQVLGQVT